MKALSQDFVISKGNRNADKTQDETTETMQNFKGPVKADLPALYNPRTVILGSSTSSDL